MDAQSPPPKSALKNPYIYSALILLGVAAYVGFILISRHESNRAYERRKAEQGAKQRREEDRAAIEQLGGSDLAIRALYVSPAVIHHGESAQICYDVANAKTVTLDPPAGEVWPSHNRCLDISPQKTTTYTLTIVDSTGKSASQTVELAVR
ncbi:MAG: hypothetical protein WAK48_20595 [Candidatus Acidiferrum sp.]|jgi:hypothetical protein